MVRKFVASAVVTAGLAGGLLAGQGLAAADTIPPDMPAGAVRVGNFPSWDACQAEYAAGVAQGRYLPDWHICYRIGLEDRDLWVRLK